MFLFVVSLLCRCVVVSLLWLLRHCVVVSLCIGLCGGCCVGWLLCGCVVVVSLCTKLLLQ